MGITMNKGRGAGALGDVIARRKAEERCGVYSCCSANEDVLIAAIDRAVATGSILLVEATANQVNQFGGYTGKTPEEFACYVRGLAHERGLALDKLCLGGDHLGPLVWRDEPEAVAMRKAETLVRAFVAAGYEKIHLDTSMRLGDDDRTQPFPVSLCAARGARLCAACEHEFSKRRVRRPGAVAPVYVIGSEVPVPGGEVGNDPSSNVTTRRDCDLTVQAYREAFEQAGIDDAFERVAAMVVEMGAEFSEYEISEYDHSAFVELAEANEGSLIAFEAHSTDYQTRENLARMREDGALFLKVGPALTFAARSALFKLELIERELVREASRSRFRDVLESAMVANPSKWKGYYSGTGDDQAFARAFSFSDRCRYYLDVPEVKRARARLLDNLEGVGIPACILLEYFPAQYARVRRGLLEPAAKAVLHDSIGDVIDDYLFATDSNGASRA